MSTVIPWLRILLAVSVYILIAISASVIIRKFGGNIKEMQGRTSSSVLIIGALTNIVIMAFVLLMLKYIDHRPVTSLGLLFSGKESTFSGIGIALILLLAVLYVGVLRFFKKLQVTPQKPIPKIRHIYKFIGSMAVLFIVAAQEEVLYRGYITLNLLHYSPLVIIIASTLIFAAIHLLTNKAGFYQIVSWILGGVILSFAYLISGSIWIPILLHFITDATNVIIFNIVGQYSFFTLSPALSRRQLAAYRVIYSAGLVAALLLYFGPGMKLIG